MGSLYCVSDKEEIDRRKKLLDKSVLVDVWQDLYASNISWLGDDQARRMAYTQRQEHSPVGLYWIGETSKKALDSVGGPLQFVLALDDHAVPVYYGPHLTDLESLPSEESLKARVLSAHGIAVAWVTYDQFGERNSYQPSSPIDPTFYLRRPGAQSVHLWRLFRSKREAVIYMTEYFAKDPEANDWAAELKVENFERLIEKFAQKS